MSTWPARAPGNCGQFTGQVTDVSLGPQAVAPAVEAEDPGLPPSRPDQPHQQPDEGRLPRAIGAEEPEHLPGRHREVEIEQPVALSVVLGQASAGDGRCDRTGVLVPLTGRTSLTSLVVTDTS